ncbi:hypothetical protein AGABI2DRAFT_194192 [Agaricus bisporus var. bisporus H97]|uniref:hypothetical protein n=1 Tax=Agaricus bisporus var. bisporus (strain H97 / ATCC MYA-4626 / FGSC 10389) TaxID=936046 RepID=UPI00029F5ED1|nr:hypothetical protein AGABI2DRAFT_194192 [Agaricus bisporus var. bisporus H97]EKV45205.1 hypothetical protein AGABI2DRAFT_194192 [Agaricus bisporus var. bisporus H97]
MKTSWLLTLAAAFCCIGGINADLVDDIVNAITHAVDCASCHALLLPLAGLALIGDGALTGTITAVCKALGVEDDDVCEGVIGDQGPILAHDLRSISPFGRTATLLCEATFGLCQAPAVNQFKFPLPAAPVNPKKWTSSGREPFQVVHFSDVHIDRDYTPGAEVQCTKPICCRNWADAAGEPIKEAAGPIGSHSCDTSTSLIQSMLHAASIQENSFSIFTGDVIEADIWLVNQNGVTSNLKQFDEEMQTIMTNSVFPVMGNHDVAPVNSFPRNTSDGATSSQWAFDVQSSGWSKWLDASAIDSVQHMSGSYSILVPGRNLRVISMNDIYWYKANFWLFDSDNLQRDPNGILTFVAEQLQAAEDAGQRAWIIAHMPPNSGDALHDQSNYFDQIVRRYSNTIAGQFYGHTHRDEFGISYSDYDNRIAENAISTSWICPSTTPRSGNPAFKVYDVDPDTFEVMDARVFFSDVNDASFQTAPQWTQYYSAREVYGAAIPGGWPATTPLTPAFWHKVTEAFERDDNLFKKYLEFKNRGINVETCAPGACKDQALCQLRAGRSESNCQITTPGLNFRRRDSEESHKHDGRRSTIDHCEGTGLGTILSQMPGKMAGANIEGLRQKLAEQSIQWEGVKHQT